MNENYEDENYFMYGRFLVLTWSHIESKIEVNTQERWEKIINITLCCFLIINVSISNIKNRDNTRKSWKEVITIYC